MDGYVRPFFLRVTHVDRVRRCTIIDILAAVAPKAREAFGHRTIYNINANGYHS